MTKAHQVHYISASMTLKAWERKYGRGPSPIPGICLKEYMERQDSAYERLLKSNKLKRAQKWIHENLDKWRAVRGANITPLEYAEQHPEIQD